MIHPFVYHLLLIDREQLLDFFLTLLLQLVFVDDVLSRVTPAVFVRVFPGFEAEDEKITLDEDEKTVC